MPLVEMSHAEIALVRRALNREAARCREEARKRRAEGFPRAAQPWKLDADVAEALEMDMEYRIAVNPLEEV